MDISKIEYQPKGRQSNPLSAAFHIVLGLVRGIIGWVTFTQEDRAKAGIYFGDR
jgi:hypothetical protein